MFQTTNKASVINYDEKSRKSIKHRNELMPHSPGIFNAILCGPTGSGKTNALLNMLYDFLTYNKVYIYANNGDQLVYEKLKQHLDGIAEKNDLEPSDLYHFGGKLSEVVPVDEMDKSKVNIVIFDDFVLSKNQDIIEEYYIRGRHKNCIVFYLSQTYSGIPITIRRNTRLYLLYAVSRGRDIGLIQSDVSPELDTKQFKKLFHQATMQPHSFLWVDRYATPDKKFRREFDGILKPGVLDS
jgi:hypothetical protein